MWQRKSNLYAEHVMKNAGVESITDFGLLMIPDCSVETLTMELKLKYYLMKKWESLEKTLKLGKKLTEDRVARW